MAERTYLYSYGDGPFGASSTRRTREYILAQPKFAQVHPVLMARLFDLCDAVQDAGSDYGFGGGWRSSVDQKNLFVSRYVKVDKWTGLYWDGSPDWPELAGYYVHASGAPSAPPGRSYHESTTGDGFALAVDMVGNHKVGNPMAARFQLKQFADVNGEPWHYQPIEIPNARRSYGGEFENVKLPEEDPMTPLDVPDRVYDSRTKGGQFKAGEVRKIPVGMCRMAHVHITAVGMTPGWVSISGTDTPSESSLLNFDADGVMSAGAPIGLPDGHVRVKCSAPADIIVDVFARG